MGSGLIITPSTLCTITGCSILCLVCRMKSLSYSQWHIAIYTMLIGIRHGILCYLKYHQGICPRFFPSAGFVLKLTLLDKRVLCNLRKGGGFKAFGCSYFNLKAGALSQTHDRAVERPPRGLASYTSKAQEEKARICACKSAQVPLLARRFFSFMPN